MKNKKLYEENTNVIKVIGVGGGGSNAVNHMFTKGIKGVDYVICNTDAQALGSSAVPNKIQLGASVTEGLGAGANPNMGKCAAEESIEELKEMFGNQTKVIFITAGMGGGTGTGAAPVIAEVAKSLDILTIGVVTSPFQYEGERRNEQAQIGIKELQNNVDILIVINNNNLVKVYGELDFREAYIKADEVVSHVIKNLIISTQDSEGGVPVDFYDIKSILGGDKKIAVWTAEISEKERKEEAVNFTFTPSFTCDIEKVRRCLVLISSGNPEITVKEVTDINNNIREKLGRDIEIIMGINKDRIFGKSISITVWGVEE